MKKQEKEQQLQAKLQIRRAQICNKAQNVLPRFDKPIIPDTPLPGAMPVDPFMKAETPKVTGETPFKGAKRNNPLHEKKNAYKEQVDRRVEEIADELNVNLSQARVLYAQNESLRSATSTPAMAQTPRSPGTPIVFYTPPASSRPVFTRQATTDTISSDRSAFLSSPRMDQRFGFSRDAAAAITGTVEEVLPARSPVPQTTAKAQRTMGLPATSPSTAARRTTTATSPTSQTAPLRIKIDPRPMTMPVSGSPGSVRTPGTPRTPSTPRSMLSENSNPREPSGGYFDELHPAMLTPKTPRTPGSVQFEQHPEFATTDRKLNSPTRGILKSGKASPPYQHAVIARRGVLVRAQTGASISSVDTTLVQPLHSLSLTPHHHHDEEDEEEEDDDDTEYGEYSPRSPANATFDTASTYSASIYSPVVRFDDARSLYSEPGTPRGYPHYAGTGSGSGGKKVSGLGVKAR